MTKPPAPTLSRKDFQSDQDVRWCPGCGDYSILAAVQKVFPTLGIPKENFAIVSGIGCAARFPYYMDTYGFHSIHGRAPAIATGVKIANPDLSVWVITGDGDALSIGGNHLIHALRRNVDINLLLFNNEIYGLTKGQTSPTSAFGKQTKSTPDGNVARPVNPASLCIGAQATFYARTVAVQPKHLQEMVVRAFEHKGTSIVEISQNCNIFNDGAFDHYADRSVRSDQQLILEDGKPLIFGKNKDRGIRLNGLNPEVVTWSDGQAPDDLVIHDEGASAAYAMMLSELRFPDYPTPLGVFRSTKATVFEDVLHDQVKAAGNKKESLQEMVEGRDTWTAS
jgi:2-oxoglutarate/2-oxoacid ferredoxin oxidoreductase subunit beta